MSLSLSQILPDRLIFKGNFLNGQWATVPSSEIASWTIVSPASSEWVLEPCGYNLNSVENSVAHAASALKTWKYTSLEHRISLMKKFSEELAKRKDLLGRVIAIETGKPFDEALAEAGLLVSKIQVTIDYGLELVKSSVVKIDDKQQGEIHWKPKGVMLVIGPFNFPVHLSHGHIAPALLMGNVVILKPSEKTPYSAQVYTDAVEAAGFPPGVFQLIQGPGEVANRLTRHEMIDGVVATCSYEVGAKIQKALAESPEKIVALEMGGKNAALVWDHKDISFLSDELIKSCFLTTGQRCTGLSRVYIQRNILSDVVQQFHEKAKQLSFNHPFETNPKPYMGPLISAEAVEKFLRYSTIAENEGAQSIMRPKLHKNKTRLVSNLLDGNYVSPSIHVIEKSNRDSAYQQHEIFGPDVFFCPVDSLEEGINCVNSSRYGLVASVFSNQKDFTYAADRINCGLIYHNRATVGASARLPFGGWGRSGNHRPAGLFAIYACSQVQARMV